MNNLKSNIGTFLVVEGLVGMLSWFLWFISVPLTGGFDLWAFMKVNLLSVGIFLILILGGLNMSPYKYRGKDDR